MTDDDIYGNKARYERFMQNLDSLKIPVTGDFKRGKRKYYCRNPDNLVYFKKLHKLFETKDNSYVRRVRLFGVLSIIVYVAKKELSECNREDINEIVAFSHTVNISSNSKEDFIKDLKYIWKCLFPEKDEKGRFDETLMPYAVRHLSSRIEKSKQKLRNDRLNWEEFEKLIGYFSRDSQMQLYLSLAVESLGRPQEILYTRIADLDMQESYAKIYISSHGKEGTKFLQCIDSYPYLVKWFEKHPYKTDKHSFLFITNGMKDRQLTPLNLSKKLKLACRKLGIDKNITAYSLKRNGVTFARLRGDSDIEIQHRAGWTSTKQLKTYDLSTGEDSFKKMLAKRGLIQDDTYKDLFPKTKVCICGAVIGFAEKICFKCKRLTDKKAIKSNIENEDMVTQILERLTEKNKQMVLDVMTELKLKERIEQI